MAPDDIRSCVIVLTVWVESTDSNDDLRARFAVAALREGKEDRESFAACGIDDVCMRLRMWLERFAGGESGQPVVESNQSVLP
jgi:hypothetical protein